MLHRSTDKIMANKIPIRFKRMAAAFEEEVARARFSESSGSEHSPADEGSMNLSDLVDSLMEGEYRNGEPETNVQDRELEICDSYSEMEEELKKLLGDNLGDEMKNNIREEVERVYGDSSNEEDKRHLMIRLRQKGFDAGLCKSKWEKTGKYPSGSYEYIDIKESNNDHGRYIIEINLANEFAIASPTKFYSSLLDLFPYIFVGKEKDLKKIVRLMFRGMKDSLKSMDMSMPPWRSHGYQQAKWFSGFKRTLNEFPVENGSDLTVVALKRRWVGFEPVDFVSSGCNFRKNLGGARVGLLALALNS